MCQRTQNAQLAYRQGLLPGRLGSDDAALLLTAGQWILSLASMSRTSR